MSVAPVADLHIKTRTSGLTVFVGHFQPRDDDHSAAWLRFHLFGDVHHERREVFPVFQAHFELQGVVAVSSPGISVARPVGDAERTYLRPRAPVADGGIEEHRGCPAARVPVLQVDALPPVLRGPAPRIGLRG